MSQTAADRDPDLPAGAGSAELRMWVRLLACAKFGEKYLRRRFEDEFDTTLPRFDVLAALFDAPDGLRMSELSQRLLVSNGNVTVIVRQLQERGFVASRINPHDARSAIVSLTRVGREEFLKLAEAHHCWISEIFSSVPPESIAALSTTLGEVRAIVRKK